MIGVHYYCYFRGTSCGVYVPCISSHARLELPQATQSFLAVLVWRLLSANQLSRSSLVLIQMVSPVVWMAVNCDLQKILVVAPQLFSQRCSMWATAAFLLLWRKRGQNCRTYSGKCGPVWHGYAVLILYVPAIYNRHMCWSRRQCPVLRRKVVVCCCRFRRWTGPCWLSGTGWPECSLLCRL